MHSSGQCSPRCFNSRTLGRVRLVNSRRIDRAITFQFTHPGKGATRALLRQALFYPVSIHAPWEGCDWCSAITNCYTKSVSIHAPWEGCDVPCLVRELNPGVSIHAPWEGCDSDQRLTFQMACGFNSRTLGRVRLALSPPNSSVQSFNSRTLGRVRPRRSIPIVSFWEFQFTHPGKGATGRRNEADIASTVSIHAPWEGCDHLPVYQYNGRSRVSIHAPWEGCDEQKRATNMEQEESFNSRTLGRVRQSSRTAAYA